jgi:ribosomal protein S12
MRGKDLPGVRRTSFGYHIESASVEEISKVLGTPPPKPNSPKRKVART